MQRSSSKFGRLCHSPSLSSLQRRAVGTQPSISPHSLGLRANRVDHFRETLRCFLEGNSEAQDVVKKGGMSVVDRAANWAHAERRKNRRVPSQGIPQQSVEKILSNPLDIFDDEAFKTDIGDQVLPKGSFLEVRRSVSVDPLSFRPFMILFRNNGVIHAVAMGPHYAGRTRRFLTLTTTGEAIPFNSADIMLCVPGFVQDRLVDACGPMKLHSTRAERAARTRILAELRTIEKEIENAVHYVGNRAAKLYDHLRSENPQEWKQVDVQTAARFFQRPDNSSPPLAIKIAVHKHLMDHPRNFVAHPTAYRETQTFLVRPQALVQNIADITSWMRIEGGRALDEFCDKAKVIMEQAKALRQKSTSTVPHEIPTNFSYTPADHKILRFLLDAFHVQRLTQLDPHSLPTSYILKRLGLLDDMEWPADKLSALQRLLTDLGVFSPWTDSTSVASRIDSLAHKPTIKLLRAPPYPPEPLGPEDFYASDPLEAIRHDFGDTPVYVIDDASASELDDGVSIEAIPSEPDNFWVHVHVADPTTLLPPTHKFAYRARELSESSYTAHGTSYMLPRSSFERFSLGHTAAMGERQQVMTFSFKVDAAGDLVDYKVRAAIVKNIRVLTYDAVDATLGLPSFGPTFPFKSPDASLLSHSPIEESHAKQLKLLHKVASRLIANRARLPVFNFSTPNHEIHFTHPISPHLPSPLQKPDPSTLHQLKLYGGLPDMSYSVSPAHMMDRGARAMVSEFMKGACRIASRFGVETGTPLVRRHSSGPFGPDPALIEELIASRDEFGMVDYYEVAKSSVTLSRGVSTLTPKCLWTLGIPDGEGYVKVTSPLRRYSDLVAHWQIKHTLLANSNPARYPKGRRVVFGEDWLSQYARELTFRDSERKRANNMSGGYWSGMFIKRWLDGEIKSETLDPKTAVFEARPGLMLIKDEYNGNYRMQSMVAQLGLWGDITRNEPLEIGSRVKVRIAGVRMGPKPKISLEPV